MISRDTRAQLRRCFYAEHWKIGTIASELGVHPDAVRNAIEMERFRNVQPSRPSLVDPYLEFIPQILEQHPRLHRQYRLVATGRGPAAATDPRAFFAPPVLPRGASASRLGALRPGLGGACPPRLSCFVMTLSYSRALYLEFFFDQTMENFLRGHVHAFQAWNGRRA